MASSIKIVSLKQVMVDGQLAGPVSDILAGLLSDAQTALEQYETGLIAAHAQELAARAAERESAEAGLQATIEDLRGQLAAANREVARILPFAPAVVPLRVAAEPEGVEPSTQGKV
jgi:hypothetical protein